tara:strand:+ start:1109 stop:1354 length:246 start_codon:yes stop_codon:yes gene_type:complete
MDEKANAVLSCPVCNCLSMDYQYHERSDDYLVHCGECAEFIGTWSLLQRELAVQKARIALLSPELASQSLYRRVRSAPVIH